MVQELGMNTQFFVIYVMIEFQVGKFLGFFCLSW